MYILIALASLVASATAKNFTVGDGGTKAISQDYIIWKRDEAVIVDVRGIITRIDITDNGQYENQEVEIVKGGIGFKHVTIEMIKPEIIEGYKFKVQIYTELGNQQETSAVPFHTDDYDEEENTVVQAQIAAEEAEYLKILKHLEAKRARIQSKK